MNRDIMPTETYLPRGIGKNWLTCYICGKGKGKLQADMAAFVDSKEAGERIVSMYKELGLHAILDYRDHEPNWIQVKIGACKTHSPNLKKLYKITGKTKEISPATIVQSLI